MHFPPIAPHSTLAVPAELSVPLTKAIGLFQLHQTPRQLAEPAKTRTYARGLPSSATGPPAKCSGEEKHVGSPPEANHSASAGAQALCHNPVRPGTAEACKCRTGSAPMTTSHPSQSMCCNTTLILKKTWRDFESACPPVMTAPPPVPSNWLCEAILERVVHSPNIPTKSQTL